MVSAGARGKRERPRLPKAWGPRCKKPTDRLRPGKTGPCRGRHGARARLPAGWLLARKLWFPTILCGWLPGLSASGRRRPPLRVPGLARGPSSPTPAAHPPSPTIRLRKMRILCCTSSLIGLGWQEGHSTPQEGRGLPTNSRSQRAFLLPSARPGGILVKWKTRFHPPPPPPPPRALPAGLPPPAPGLQQPRLLSPQPLCTSPSVPSTLDSYRPALPSLQSLLPPLITHTHSSLCFSNVFITRLSWVFLCWLRAHWPRAGLHAGSRVCTTRAWTPGSRLPWVLGDQGDATEGSDSSVHMLPAG